MKKSRPGTLTHYYKRHSTSTLFAALDVLEGEVIGGCMKRHRHQEFSRFSTPPNAKSRPQSLSVPSSTTTPPTSIQGDRLARPPPLLELPPHPDQRLLAQRRRGLLRRPHQSAASSAASSRASTSRLPSNRFVADHNRQPRPSHGSPTRQNYRRRKPRAPNIGFNPLGKRANVRNQSSLEQWCPSLAPFCRHLR